MDLIMENKISKREIKSAFSNIKGFNLTSLVDWDGRISAVMFLGGCNFRCRYCSNKELVLSPESIESISFDKIKESLERNREFIDGIVITGGEPTIYSDLPELCSEIKKLGFKVKMDTNGSNPDMLKELLEKKLVDFIAMDIKTCFEKYKDIAGFEVNIDKIKKSISIVSGFPEYEFRTTIFPEITNQDLLKIVEYLKEKKANKAFFLHQFRNDSCINEELENTKPYKKEEIIEMHNSIKNYFDKSGVRNI